MWVISRFSYCVHLWQEICYIIVQLLSIFPEEKNDNFMSRSSCYNIAEISLWHQLRVSTMKTNNYKIHTNMATTPKESILTIYTIKNRNLIPLNYIFIHKRISSMESRTKFINETNREERNYWQRTTIFF